MKKFYYCNMEKKEQLSINLDNNNEGSKEEKNSNDVFLRRNVRNRLSLQTGRNGWKLQSKISSKTDLSKSLRSARLPQTFTKPQPLKGLLAQTAEAVSGNNDNDDSLAGPYSTVEETARYTMSDTIGREYTPQARGLTMAQLHALKPIKKSMKSSRSEGSLKRGQLLETAIPSPSRAAPFAAWRPKPERKYPNLNKWAPMKKSEITKSIAYFTRATPPPYSVPHADVILSKSSDEYLVERETVQAVREYWEKVRNYVEEDTDSGSLPPLKQEWLENVNDMIPRNMYVSDELLNEWYFDYVRCVGQSRLNYELLIRGNPNLPFSKQDLEQFPEWWTNDEYKCPAWKVLRIEGREIENILKATDFITRVKDTHSMQISLDIARMWSKCRGEDLELTEVLTKEFRSSLPLRHDELVSEVEVQNKQMRGEVKDMFIKDTYAIIEHKCAWLGASFLKGTEVSKAAEETKGPLEDESRTKLLNYNSDSTSNIQPSLITLPEDALSYQIIRASSVQMRSKIREMGDKSLKSYVKFFQKFNDHSERDGKKYFMVVKGSENVRVSAVNIILAASKHANRGMHFTDAIRAGSSVLPQGIFRVNCKYDKDQAKMISFPSHEEILMANDTILENIREAANTSMNDVNEILASSAPADKTGIVGEVYAYTPTSDIFVETKSITNAIIEKQYKEVGKIIAILSRYENIFNDELDDYTEKIISTEPIGKDRKQKLDSRSRTIQGALKRLTHIENCAINALDSYEGRDLFYIDLTIYQAQVKQRIQSLKDVLVRSYAKVLDQLMEAISTEYGKVAETLCNQPEDSEELKELIEYFDDIQPRIVEMKDTVRQEIFTMAQFLFKNKHIYDVRSTALFWSCYGWPDEMENVMERSIHIQNQEKIKREEILVSRRLYFEKELESLDRDSQKISTFDSLENEDVKTYNKRLTGLSKMLENTIAEAASINEQETVLQIDSGETDYAPRLDDLKQLIEGYAKFWSAAHTRNQVVNKLMTRPLWEQDAEEVENDMDNFRRQFIKFEKDFKSKDMNDEADIAATAQEQCNDFLNDLHPLMALLCTRGLKKRHWDSINKLTGLFIPYAQNANLKQMINYGLHNHVEAITDTCINASKEFSLEQAMDKMEEEWAPMVFGSKAWKDTGTFILTSVEEIEQILDDQIVRTQAMRGSRFIKPFTERITAWAKILQNIEEVIGIWLKVQSTWLYLEPIFSSEDIRKQMPMEAKRFATVDRTWRDIMQGLQEDSSCISIGKKEGMIDRLEQASKLLDLIQKGLSDYLNTKRVFFPRFFFLSNDELLEILSETKDPKRVLPHLKKCFEGVNSLEFQSDLSITSIISKEKEVIPLDYEAISEKTINPNDSGGCVEIWLDQIQTVMRKMMAHLYDLSMVDYGKREPDGDRTGWLKDWPGQIVLGVSQTYWTTVTTEALKSGPKGTKALHQRLTAHLNDIIQMVRTPQKKIVKRTIGPLCVLDVHARDTVVELERLGIDDPNDFDWLCQFRYYWHEGGESMRTGAPGTVVCKMINAQRLYAYEYLGNSMRLVVTPLTDRCYRTLMGAIHLDYGGAPAGPAGTGKTETVKDLGKNCAIQCVVYNCSDSLDYLAMGKFFKGLAGTGAWSCFDEFNRINLEVLSVIAQQILTITRAKVAGLDRFDFEGENIQLRRTCNVFVTMNPGYAGRQELPDNLKALFRSVAMMVPDYAQIGQIILYSMGYLDGLALARKIVMTYKLCSEQLSNQKHYDYGMRAVMAVLRTSGNLKKKHPDAPEAALCLRAIVDVNLPKFLAPDVPLFKGIVGDLFPGVELEEVDYGTMHTCLLDMCKKNILQPTDYFKTKVFEIYETMVVRHGFMVVGKPFAGKTNALRMLQETLTEMKIREPDNPKWQKTYATVINPKSIPMGQLYGQFDPQTHEWSDGVLAITYRNYAAEPPKVGNPEDFKWVWFDGPVDAIWIENMNTVLDDNKKLCLMSGEMISMSDTMNMIFEPMDLEVASPATVSRVGVVYLEPHRMGWTPCVDSWIQRLSVKEGEDVGRQWILTEEEGAQILDLFMWIADPAICYVKTACNCRAPTVDQQLIVACLRFIEYHIEEFLGDKPEEDGKKKKKNDEKKKKLTPAQIDSIFMFSMIWSICSITDDASREMIDIFIREFISDPACVEGASYKNTNTQLLLRGWKYPYKNWEPRKLGLALPSKQLIFDYMYDMHNAYIARYRSLGG